MLGKILAVAAASLTIGTLALPGTVFAHSNHIRVVVKDGCTTGINVEAHDYPAQPAGASSSVTVEYDGQVTFQKLFGPQIKDNAPNPDKTVAHLYRVTFDRFDYVGPDGDRVYTGTIPACADATTTTTVPATTTTVDLATDVPPVPSTTSVPCQEDQPCWDCTQMGNQICGTTTTVATFICAGVIVADVCVVPTTTTVAPPTEPSSLPSTGSRTDIELAIGLSALAIGWCLLRIRRSRA